jgi:hypothetical protein
MSCHFETLGEKSKFVKNRQYQGKINTSAAEYCDSQYSTIGHKGESRVVADY